MAESARKPSSLRPQLAAVASSPPSVLPDTSDLDIDWADESGTRQSFIATKSAHAKTLPLPPQMPRPRLATPLPSVRPSLPPSAMVTTELAYDLWDSPRALLLLVDLPGVDPAHVALKLGSHALYLEVDVASEAAQPGIAAGHHEVTIALPDGIGPDALDASFSDGVLRVRISKVEAGVRRIGVAKLDD